MNKEFAELESGGWAQPNGQPEPLVHCGTWGLNEFQVCFQDMQPAPGRAPLLEAQVIIWLYLSGI